MVATLWLKTSIVEPNESLLDDVITTLPAELQTRGKLFCLVDHLLSVDSMIP